MIREGASHQSPVGGCLSLRPASDRGVRAESYYGRLCATVVEDMVGMGGGGMQIRPLVS